MAWVFLLLAGFGEMSGMFFLKLSDGFTKLKPTILAVTSGAVSFYFLSLSLQEVQIGTAYGIWTGIGSVGTVLLGIFFFKEKVNRKRILFIICILAGVIGLKMVS
ncbi:multidrug efflux SMR transporter [Halobacillus yeomjeoni]|uniref:Multidrug efflux SMR transporter n=1 Tax=Halobacillus yeomjeoni TaxID=311194 RepID=A0A931MVZ7_9BACI|nr:multidrug efflux SMR transporter [Halobacillus yeomjeoni]MBH0231177.1 multidrug efflux SMR transporter [Halobacillus yeomjeoni]MCA0984092.1 multidrug efflux SMR transporter [Halobacillus yeomjeoni]